MQTNAQEAKERETLESIERVQKRRRLNLDDKSENTQKKMSCADLSKFESMS